MMYIEQTPEQEDLQRRLMHYFRANTNERITKRRLMWSMDLNHEAKNIQNYVKFHWAILRLNDMLRPRHYIIAEQGLRYEFREISN